MEVSYQKDGNRNIMIIRGLEIDEKDYKFQMIINNKIRRIIPISIESVNNQKELHYEITCANAVSGIFSGGGMSGNEVYGFIKELKALSDSLKEYLLDLGNIILDFEFIFFNRQSGKYEFCYIPDGKKDLHVSMREMFDRLLQLIDYNDKEAVLIAYGIQQVVVDEDFTVTDIVNCAMENIQKYEKQQEAAEEYFKEETDEKQHDEYNVNVKKTEKKNWLINIINSMKKRNTYLSEEELEQNNNVLNEQKAIYNRKEYMYQTETTDTEPDTTCLKAEEETETTLLKFHSIQYGISFKSLNQKNMICIIPDKNPFLIGKSASSCDFVIDSCVVSRKHLKVTKDLKECWVEDTNSTNGTFINDKKISPGVPEKIKKGDKIAIANIEFVVE